MRMYRELHGNTDAWGHRGSGLSETTGETTVVEPRTDEWTHVHRADNGNLVYNPEQKPSRSLNDKDYC